MARGTKKADDRAAQIEEARRKGLSWKAVGETLGLGSPSATRKLFTELTGRHHNDIEGVEAKAPRAPRAPKAKPEQADGTPAAPRKVKRRTDPEWSADTPQEEIIDALEPVMGPGHVPKSITKIVVERPTYGDNPPRMETYGVYHFIRLTWVDKETSLAAEFHDDFNHGFRCIRVQDIKEVIR